MKIRPYVVLLVLACGAALAEAGECRDGACEQRTQRKPFTERLPRETPVPERVSPAGPETPLRSWVRQTASPGADSRLQGQTVSRGSCRAARGAL